MGKVICTGLGPGDPDLMSVKADRLVRSSAQAVLRRAPKMRPGGERAAVAFLRREARLAAPEGAGG